jgi:hypothetical protein
MADRPQIIASTTVQLGTRHVYVDDKLLRNANPYDSQRRTVVLRQLSDDCLVLEPRKWAVFWKAQFILGLCAGALAGLAYTLVEELQASWQSIVLQAIGIPLLLGIIVFPFWILSSCRRWIRFDRRTGLMTISRRRLGWGRGKVVTTRPLNQFIAVQILDGGLQTSQVETGEPGTPFSMYFQQYYAYQLNLVLDDTAEPRLNVAWHADGRWMREAAERLAAFLGVPVLDRLGDRAK